MFIAVVASPRIERQTERHMRGSVLVRDKMVRSRPSAPCAHTGRDGALFSLSQHAAPARVGRLTVRAAARAERRHQFKFVPVYPGKASTGQRSVSRFPAARGLCGNGRKAKTGGMYG
jgi:hypothetical protein